MPLIITNNNFVSFYAIFTKWSEALATPPAWIIDSVFHTCFQIERSFMTSTLFAQYSSFIVNSESTRYQLSVSGYTGNAGNALMAGCISEEIANGKTFSTPDSDSSGGCAREGGWWFESCSCSWINSNSVGIWMVTWPTYYNVVASRMMITCSDWGMSLHQSDKASKPESWKWPTAPTSRNYWSSNHAIGCFWFS